MIEAYVLIHTDIRKTRQVVEELRKIHGVVTAAVVAGPYDAIARIEAVDLDSLGKLLVNKIQGVDGLNRTLTCSITAS
ncbi:MAG: Lrp/AsnC ligand binding domain-containing protein [Acidimicrobiia bacterium]|nr:Lrp/AsnC ligand binding domain-containing protein [Acidimicrobiia bacterium]